MGPSHQPRRQAQQQLLEQLAAEAEAAGAGLPWRQLMTAFRVDADPGAVFVLIEALGRAAAHGPRHEGTLDAHTGQLVQLLLHLERFVDALDPSLRIALENPLRGRHRAAGAVRQFPLLASFTGVVAEALAARVDALRLLIVAALAGTESAMPASVEVADAVRKSQSIPEPWRAVLEQLPDPAGAPMPWLTSLGQFLAQARAADLAARFGRASRTEVARFFSALGVLLAAVGAPRRRPPWPVEADAVASEFVERQAAPGSTAVRSAPAVADRTPQPRLFLQFFSDEPSKAGEPQRVELLREAAVGPESDPAPQAARAHQARLTSFRLIEVDQLLRWSWDHLNWHDLDIVIRAVARELEQPQAASAGALLAALVLATGVAAGDIAAVPIGDFGPAPGYLDRNGRWVRRVLRPTKAWVPDAGQRQLIKPALEELTLRLPAAIERALLRAMRRQPAAGNVAQLLGIGSGDAVQQLSAWLEPLRTRHPAARLTHGRLARALRVELMAVTHDPARVHFLAATAQDVVPIACYYASYPGADLVAAYSTAVARLFLTEADACAATPGPAVVGAYLAPAEAPLRRFVASLQNHLDACAAGGWVAIHNAFAWYTLWLLMAATGHRPVQDPFESIDLFDLDHGWAVIHDKLVRPGRNGRLVPLPALAVAQLRHYLAHLQRVASHLDSIDTGLATLVRDCLAPMHPRALPLFFLLAEDGAAARRIAQNELRAALGPLGALAPNLMRHALASAAAQWDVDSDLVHEALGHMDLGQPAFGGASPLAPADYAPLRLSLERHLQAQGWRAAPSPLPATPGDARDSAHAAPGIAQRRSLLPLGAEARRRTVAERERRVAALAREAVREVLAGKSLNRLAQTDVEAMFGRVTGGRPRPGTLVELGAYERVFRFVAHVRRRHGLTLALPPRYRPLPLEPAPFAEGSLALAMRGDALERAFIELLADRARGLRNALAQIDRAVAEAIVSLVVHSHVLDVDLLLSYFRAPALQVQDAGALGLFAQFTVGRPNARSEVRRYPLHPMTAVLLTRLLRLQARAAVDSRRGEPRDTIHRLRLRVEGGGAESFDSAAAALRWLVDRQMARTRLALPGTLVGFLSGATGAVSVPRDDFVRILTGRPPQRRHATGQNDERPALAPAADSAFDDAPAALLPPAPRERDAGSARARALALHRAVLRAHGRHAGRTRAARNRTAAQSLGRSEHIKRLLRPDLDRLCEQHRDAPDIALLLVHWLAHLLDFGSYEAEAGRALRASSCIRYYVALAPSAFEALASAPLRTLDEDALASAYADVLDTVDEGGQSYVFGRLLEFHRFLVERHGLPPVNWAEVAPVSCLCTVSVDAGLITWPEYESVLRLLIEDPSADLRTRQLHGMAWFTMYRFGARVAEALGVRRKDIVVDGARMILLLRPNDYRDIKTDAGIRQVPLIGALSPREQALVAGWMEHIDAFAGSDHLGALFGEDDRPRRLMDRSAIERRLTEALRAVTGCARHHLHHARHAFACRLELLMSLERMPSAPHWRTVCERIVGPCEPAATRRLLLDSPARSKRGFWAMAQLMGHAGPAVSQRSYAHLGDLLAAGQLGPGYAAAAMPLDRETLRYVTGFVRLPASLAPAASNVVGLAFARRAGDSTIIAIDRLAAGQAYAPQLPPRPPPVAPPLSAARADHALDLAHRRGRLDGIAQTLLLPAAQIEALFTHERTVRTVAGYDIADSGWLPVPASAAVSHRRAGARLPAETRRVRPFLRALEPALADGDFRALTATVCTIWQQRYKADCTPLVLGERGELQALLDWLVRAGIGREHIEVRCPADGMSVDAVRAALQGAGIAERSLVPVPLLPNARGRFRAQGRSRVGVILRENDAGPLTGMAQLHRVLHVLSSVVR